MASTSQDITALLHAVREGDREALDRLFRLVYDELRTIAHAQRRRWTGDETMGTTAIVHEAYLKLAGVNHLEADDRSHFFTLASRAMRQILLNYARDRKAKKRGGGRVEVSLDTPPLIGDLDEAAADRLIALDRALEELEGISGRPVRVVECRFFAGLTVAETAEALGISAATVKRDWAHASTWLRRRLEGERAGPGPAP
ncbi:MAG: ECF-type sigma factor [Gemmatimonadota bacterium]|nr:ECF-type sigma factor [Gemmatimonadota bacterium]